MRESRPVGEGRKMRVWLAVARVALVLFAQACGGGSASSPSTVGVPVPLAPGPGVNASSACTGDAWVFIWTDIGAKSYQLQVTSPSGTVFVDREGIESSTFSWPQAPILVEAGSAGWRFRVRGRGPDGYGAWSAEALFGVDPLYPRMTSPLADTVLDNGCTNGLNATEWTFQWSSCVGADRYHFEISDSSGLYLASDKLATPTYDYRLNDYIANSTDPGWNWRVRAHVNGDWGPWTASRSFRVEPVNTDCSALPAPSLLSPSNGAVFSAFPRVTELKWAALPGAASYRVEIETCAGGDTLCVGPPVQGLTETVNLLSASYVFTFGGAQSGRWRVLAFAADGRASPWSETRYFRYTR